MNDFYLQDGMLCHIGQICVLEAERKKLICEAHYSKGARHFGIGKTLATLKRYFYCQKIKNDIIAYIQACTTCAIAKPTNRKYGLYPPLSIPKKPWHLISMDFMSSLPTTR